MKQFFSKGIWLWEGREFGPNELPFSSLQALIESCKDDHRPFLSFYEGQYLKSHLTYHQYFTKAARVALQIQKIRSELQHQSFRVATFMANSDDLLIVYAGCFLAGATIVPINPSESVEHVEKIILHAKCQLLISSALYPTKVCRVILTHDLVSSEVENDFGIFEDKKTAANQIAAIFYTSGTTSSPKGVMLSHRSILANLVALKSAHRLDHESRHYCVLPLYHVNAFGFSFLTMLLAKGALVLSDRFRAETFWRILLDEKCETSNLVPEVVSQLTAKTNLAESDFALVKEQVHYFVSAASALSRDLLRRFLDKFSIKVFQGYGLSETVNFSLLVPPFMSQEEYDLTMLGFERPSAGMSIDGNEVEVINLAGDSLCVEGEVGEVVIRGWNVMSAYLDNAEATAQAFKDDWFHSGDLGFYRRIGGNKYFFVCGRLKEIVKRNSETIYTQEVEEVLQLIEGCQVSAVAGFENFWTGEELAAVIVKDDQTPDIDKIIGIMKSKVGFAKAPKVVKFVESIPRTGSMKVKRKDIGLMFPEHISTNFSKIESHAI